MEPAAVLRLLLTAEGVKETQLQLARVNAEAKRTADSTGRLEKEFTRANNRTSEFNKNMMGLRNVMGLLKWPALIAGAGGAAQAVGALGGAAVSLVSALAPLSGALAGVAGMYGAAAEAGLIMQTSFTGVGKALTGNAAALDKLLPAQKTFVHQIQDTYDKVKGLRNAVAAGMLPGAAKAINSLLPLINRLRPAIVAAAQAMGSLSISAANMLRSMGGPLQRIAQSNVIVIHNLGTAVIAAARGLIILLDAARPLTQWMSQLVARGAQWVASQLAAAQASGKLAHFLGETRDVMTTLGHIIGNLVVGLFNIGKAAFPLGTSLLHSFEQLTLKFREWTQSATGKNQIAAYFAAVRAPAFAVFHLIGELGKVIGQVFKPQPGTAGMIGQLQQLVHIIGGILSTTARTLGPPLIHLIANLVSILSSLAGTSGPLTLLVKALAAITTPIAHMVSHNPALGTMASFLAGVGVTWKVLSLLKSPLEHIVTNVKRLTDLTQKVIAFGSSWGGLKGKVAQGVEGAGQELGQFPRKVTNTMNDAEGAAKTGSGKIMDQFRSVFTKVNLFRGFGIALGVALVGGLVTMIAQGLAKDDPDARGRQWASRFLKGVQGVRGVGGRGAPLINPLSIPDQQWFTQQAGRFVGKYISVLDQRTFLARFARGATYLINNPALRAQTTQAAAGLATVIAKSFGQRWSQVRFPTQPAFIQDVLMYLNRVPPWARAAASRSLAQYAAGLEQSKKLPVGATTATIVAIERKWPALVNYLGEVSGKGAARVAATFKMSAARKSMQQTLANIRGQWGLESNFFKTNNAGITREFTSTFNFLKWVITHRTGEARAAAIAQMKQLRGGWGDYLNQMYHGTSLQMARIQVLIATHSKNAANAASTNFHNVAASVAGAMNAGINITKRGTQIMGQALNQMLRAFGQKPIPLAGLSAGSLLQWSQWWQQGAAGGGGGSGGIGHRARGGMVDRPAVMVGEEAPRHPEVVIATNPAYRSKNVQYWAKAGQMLGMPGFKKGGIPGYATGGYVFPFPAGTHLGRTDMGVDAGMPVGAPIGAIGNATILNIQPNWYRGQPAIWERITSGPMAGRIIYLAEQIIPLVRAGEHVRANQAIARFAGSGTGIEMGFGAPGDRTLAQATTGYSEGQQTPAGIAFRNFILGLSHGKLIMSGTGLGMMAPPLPPAPHVLGGGTVGRIAQAGLNRVAQAAQSYVDRIMAQFAPSVGSGGSGVIGAISPATGNVLRDVYNTLKARGWNKVAIAGALGNAWRESRWNPGSIGSGGGGLWGFTSGAISLANLQNTARLSGTQWTNPSFQAAFMAAHYGGSVGALNAAGSPSRAAQIFEQTFERAGIIAMGDRIAGANRAFSMGYRKGGFLPPYAGSFANGGMVPGPTGAARTAIVHGGETISSNTTSGPLIEINGDLNVLDDFDATTMAHRLAFLIDR